MRAASLVFAALAAAAAATSGADAQVVTLHTRLSSLSADKRKEVSDYLLGCADFGHAYGRPTAAASGCRSLLDGLPPSLGGVVRQAVEAEGQKDRAASRNWFFSTEYSMIPGRDNSPRSHRPRETAPLLAHHGGGHSSGSRGSGSSGSSGSAKRMSFRETQGTLVPDEQHSTAEDHIDSSGGGGGGNKESSFVEVLHKVDTDAGDEAGNPFTSYVVKKWPAKTIPYCWGTPSNWDLLSAIHMILGMRLISSHTHVSFYHCECSARGHKVQLTFAAGQANSWVGVVHETGPGSASRFSAALGVTNLPGWRAWGLRRAATHQSINYDSTRGLATTAAHEWMHTLGFEHTHQRTDADTYVTVSDRASDTANCALSASGHGATTYHLESIMHYPADIGGHPHQCGTIAVKTPTPATIGSAAKMGNPDNNWCPCDTTYINARFP